MLISLTFVTDVYQDFGGCNSISSVHGPKEKNYITLKELNVIKKRMADNCSAQIANAQPLPGEGPPDNTEHKDMLPVDCLINGDKTVTCLKEESGSDEIYMPFNSFIKTYFDVNGEVKHYDGYDRFEFLQSFAKVCYDFFKSFSMIVYTINRR